MKDVYLKHMFTDRGNREVYTIHDQNTDPEHKKVLGELRMRIGAQTVFANVATDWHWEIEEPHPELEL